MVAAAQAPFITGGAEILVGELRANLERRGFKADVVAVPFKWYPVSELVRQALAWRLLDVTQSAGADPPVSAGLPVDVLVAAGYKWLLGPYGTGFLRLSERMQQSLEPLEWSWRNFEGTRDFNRLAEYRSAFASPASKFDHGESSAFLRLAAWEEGLRAAQRVPVS